ncbi:hypothetical protein COBT_000867 [Conglomerata obtusa]
MFYHNDNAIPYKSSEFIALIEGRSGAHSSITVFKRIKPDEDVIEERIEIDTAVEIVLEENNNLAVNEAENLYNESEDENMHVINDDQDRLIDNVHANNNEFLIKSINNANCVDTIEDKIAGLGKDYDEVLEKDFSTVNNQKAEDFVNIGLKNIQDKNFDDFTTENKVGLLDNFATNVSQNEKFEDNIINSLFLTKNCKNIEFYTTNETENLINKKKDDFDFNDMNKVISEINRILYDTQNKSNTLSKANTSEEYDKIINDSKYFKKLLDAYKNGKYNEIKFEEKKKLTGINIADLPCYVSVNGKTHLNTKWINIRNILLAKEIEDNLHKNEELTKNQVSKNELTCQIDENDVIDDIEEEEPGNTGWFCGLFDCIWF